MVVSCFHLNFTLMMFAKGTGINVYSVIWVQMDANFTLDVGSPSTLIHGTYDALQ